MLFNRTLLLQIRSDQSLSRVRVFVTPWIAAHQASLSITNSRSSPKHVHWVSDAIQSSHPLSSPSPPAFKLSQHHGLFQWVSSLHQVAKLLEFQTRNDKWEEQRAEHGRFTKGIVVASYSPHRIARSCKQNHTGWILSDSVYKSQNLQDALEGNR